MNVIAILVAAVITFLIGGFYYAILGKQLATVSPAAAAADGSMRPWQLGAEVLRCIVLTTVI
ncbi:hypothetical protein, partial [Aeromicrobium sp.]|uniref:hypothetical protein n=1 Tax=Aeromicrobium sp. TaxID=1871063 RepID=UPI003C328E2F